MNAIFLQADAVLRGRPQAVPERSPQPLVARLITCVVVFGMTYGLAMGCRSVWPFAPSATVAGDRIWLVFFSAIKVPLLLTVTFALSVPSFFIFNTLFGLRDDFKEALQGLMATQAGLAVILAALAPFTLVWYVSTSSYQSAVLFNALMFGTASLSSQRLLRGYYRPLIARDARHRWLLRLWLVLYAFVGIQMGWILRPFIGEPNSPVAFFRTESWGNAYVVLSGMVWQVLR